MNYAKVELDFPPFRRKADFEILKKSIYENTFGGAVVVCFCNNVKFLVVQSTKKASQVNDEFFEKQDVHFWEKVYRLYSDVSHFVGF